MNAHPVSRYKPYVVQAENGVLLESSKALSIGIVTSRNAGGRNREPRLTAPGITSDCIVTTAQGDTYVLKTTRKRTTNKRSPVTVKNDNAAQYARMLQLGAIGNVE